MKGLTHWEKPMEEILSLLKIRFNYKDPIHSARNLFYSSKKDSVFEKISIVLWEHYVLKKLRNMNSFEETCELYFASRPNSPERIIVFEKLLTFVEEIETARTAHNLTPHNTPERDLADAKLTELQ
jgi:hypothetical protein